MTKKLELNVFSKSSMAEVMSEHSDTECKIDYIVQCAKNALKNHKDIPAEVTNFFNDYSETYDVDYIVYKSITEAVNFIKMYKLYDLVKNPDDVYVWRGDCTEYFLSNAFLCNAVKSEILNDKKMGIEFKYDNKSDITITLFNDVKNLMTVNFNFIDLYDWIDVGTFRLSRVYIDNKLYTAKDCYIEDNKVKYTF